MNNSISTVPDSNIVEGDSVLERIKKAASISEVLRIFGACAVIASLSLFLFEGWDEGNDIQRYLKLLGMTGLLTAAGIGLSYVLKEFKGARLFFGLSLVSAVANFTILGALIYSMYQLDGSLMEYPAMATWRAISPVYFWPICICAITLLTVLARFSYSIFARKVAGPLTLSFLLVNSLLLIPVRSSVSVSFLAAIALLLALKIVQHLRCNESLVITLEAKFALGSLFIPGLIIVARALTLYHVDDVLLLTLCGVSYLSLRGWSAHLQIGKFTARAVEVAQYCLGFAMAKLIVNMLPAYINNLDMAIMSAIVILFTAYQIIQTKDNSWKSVMLNLTAFILVIANVWPAILSNLLVLKVMGILVPLFVLALVSFADKNKVKETTLPKVFALTGTSISIFTLLVKLVQLAHLSNWMMIGMVGILLILGASLYERFGVKLAVEKN